MKRKVGHSDRVVSTGASSLQDDIYEEITYQEVVKLVCESCNVVVAKKERDVEMERSWYSMRQDVEYGTWRYTLPEE